MGWLSSDVRSGELPSSFCYCAPELHSSNVYYIRGTIHLMKRPTLQGLVQAVGVSNYGPKQMQRIAKYLSKRGVPLVTAQVVLPF